jgi:CHAT domain-containing protein
LPTKTWFKQRLSSTGPYIDFYVGGKYVAQSGGGQKLAKVERSTIPLTTRDFGVEDVTLLADTFIDDALYVTQINGGKVVSVKKVSGSQLGSLKSQLDSTYQQIANGTHQGNEQASFFKGLMAESGLPAKIVISPDKWLARHPMDFHLGAKVTRSVNFFTASSEGRLNDLRVSGFFNPTLDLSGAEQEAEAIRTYIPDAQVFKREAAQLSALQSASNASVVHLSMHGQFNANDPKSSRLAFAGATRGSGVTSDPNSLYARDMYKYAALKDRDLIFAAACQTGLSAADQANENELMGILRPLTANRNKNIILSLWKVDDVATKDFVAAFYQRLAATRDVVTAFHYAQDEIRNKYQKPYYWAAFYLSKSD